MQNFAKLGLGTFRGLRTVSGAIDGIPAIFLFDTGASQTQLSNSAIEKFDLARGHVDQNNFGINGESRQYYARLQSFSIGDLKAGRRDVLVVASFAFDGKIDGIVGDDVLLQYDLEIDMAGNAVKFFRPLNCEHHHLAYWDSNAPSLSIDKLALKNPMEVVNIEINGQPVRAMLDSGAYRSVMTLDTAARLGITPDSPGVKPLGSIAGVGGTSKPSSWLAQFERVTIGAETVERPSFVIADLWQAVNRDNHGVGDTSAQADMILGLDFFQTHRVLFSESQRRFYYSYVGGKVFGSNDVALKGEASAQR